MSTNPILVDVEEAARLLCVSKSKIWSMARQGSITVVKLPPRTTRFKYDELKQLATGGTID